MPKLEIILDTDAVQQWDIIHNDDVSKSVGQLLLEIGENMLEGVTPTLTFKAVNGYKIQLKGHHMGVLRFTPEGVDPL